ncbi:MAG: class I mannose-6-phosphate isomerase [Alloprevotella sp.]|nr:class I mannose-6-phosphate isomerase [Alloprevotella sp.]
MKPIFFKPLLKQTIWGGEEVTALKQASELLERGEAAMPRVGESWEISGVEGDETPVCCGEDAGRTLPELIAKYGADLVGEENLRRYGTTFPLLIKFISAAQDLSIQVHPDDAMAQRMGHPYGKTEMWYIVKAEEGASLVSGFSHAFSAEGYVASLADGTLMQHLSRHGTQAGQCFFIPAGRIHSIGAGNFLVEIQQSSNDTFRVYDFDRSDAEGRTRQLHVEQAREALDYADTEGGPVSYEPQPGACVNLVSCPQFTTNLLELDAPFHADYSRRDSFVILIAFEGTAEVRTDAGDTFELRAGQSVLLPAAMQGADIVPKGGDFRTLETFC